MTMVTEQTSRWSDWLARTPAGNFTIAGAMATVSGVSLISSLITLSLQSFTSFYQMLGATGTFGAFLGWSAIGTLVIGAAFVALGGYRMIQRARRGHTTASWHDMAYVT